MVDNSVAQYTGNVITTEKDLSSSSLGLAEGQMFPELAHLVIGLEGVSHQVVLHFILKFKIIPQNVIKSILNDITILF